MLESYIGLGSNLAQPVEQINQAINELAGLSHCRLQVASSLYVSRPMGPQDQDDFVNAVVQLSTALSAHDLLDQLQNLEKRHHRVRERHWGPRTLDLDILLYGDQIIQDERLCVPHTEMAKRSFVLYPLYEIAPELTIPGMGKLKELKENMDGGDLKKLDSNEYRAQQS
ncbi:MAG: 2-amino-4-hydroxy-6-hydroxymethyldihydropteridine diphosphokinase [Gammaproteobacteria bacterium]|nr:2-amino-4-hydroxy-6-hydroxymethyldihydropteridine diphosphokinase [Gammaproteobacteria bacterium]